MLHETGPNNQQSIENLLSTARIMTSINGPKYPFEIIQDWTDCSILKHHFKSVEKKCFILKKLKNEPLIEAIHCWLTFFKTFHKTGPNNQQNIVNLLSTARIMTSINGPKYSFEIIQDWTDCSILKHHFKSVGKRFVITARILAKCAAATVQRIAFSDKLTKMVARFAAKSSRKLSAEWLQTLNEPDELNRRPEWPKEAFHCETGSWMIWRMNGCH